MRRPASVAIACWCIIATSLSGCGGPDPSPTPSLVPSASPTSPITPSATPTSALDLTQPGAAKDAVHRLLRAAGAERALMVDVSRSDASVTVLRGGAAQTWALRGGDPRQVQSDTTYVSQAEFDVERFDLADVGSLFRAAAAVSGSDTNQELQIVDYSAGLVMMAVSTNPESRTVFFHPDGSLLSTLDFDTSWGLTQGFTDAVGTRSTAYSVGFGAQVGVYADIPGTQKNTVSRHQRMARVPVVVTTRTDATPPQAFDPHRVDPAVVWRALEDLQKQRRWSPGQEWSCVADDRERRGTPRLHFVVGGQSFMTDLAGQRVEA